MPTEAPYGTWDSLITYDTVVSKNIVFDDVLVDPKNQTIYYIEERPNPPDNGRCVIVMVDEDKRIDVLPYPYNARTYVQEYGGAPAIIYDNVIYFSNASLDPSQPDNAIYTLKIGETTPNRVTPENALFRYANFALHPTHQNLLVTLREDHTNDPNYTDPGKVVNTICVVDMTTKTVNILIDGADFYATPVLNPSGTRIGWQEWNFPTPPWKLPGMPWDSGLIKFADVAVESGTLKLTSDPFLIGGEPGKKSATFPLWITDTTLIYITDGYNKFQNPYIFDTNTKQSTSVLKIPSDEDFAEPAWWLGLYPYAILGEGKYGAFTAFKEGRNILYIIDLTTPSDPIWIDDFDFVVAQHVRTVTKNTFVFIGSSSTSPGGVIEGTVSSSSDPSDPYTVTFSVLKSSGDVPDELKEYISGPIPMTLRDASNPLYVVYYEPKNPNYRGLPGEKPPCIVGVHGGPTGLESQDLNWIKMFFTSRGFAWLDVNYRGSSGYGREYIELLYGNWGRYDVEDCQEAATIFASDEYSLIDGKRVAIRGGSAGAYTTLSSVTFAPNLTYYKSACGAYGCVADVEHLTKVMEKFEMRYIYTLFGCAPDNGAWDAWNPIKHASNIKVPLLILQGLVDGVVPPEIVRSFLAQSSQSAPSEEFAFYPDEGHHWKKEYTIKNALAREYHWYLDTLLQ